MAFATGTRCVRHCRFRGARKRSLPSAVAPARNFATFPLRLPAIRNSSRRLSMKCTGRPMRFASMQAAWQSLDESEQCSLYGLMGVHDYAKAFRLRGADIDGDPIFTDLEGFDHQVSVNIFFLCYL